MIRMKIIIRITNKDKMRISEENDKWRDEEELREGAPLMVSWMRSDA